MPLLFWLDIGAYVVGTVLAMVLVVMALSAGTRHRLSQLFVLYAVSIVGFTSFAVLLRLSLWLDPKDAQFYGRMSAWSFVLCGPAMLLFAAHYVGVTRRWVRIAALAGLLWCFVFALPQMLQGCLIPAYTLGPNGTTHAHLSSAGMLSTIVPIAYLVAALVLFVGFRRRTGEVFMALGTLALLLGLLGGVVLDLPVPMLSLASLVSLGILGYGVLALQLFNPLRERNVALQLEIAERQRAEGEILRLQHLLEAIANSMPSALITLDLEGRVLTWNPAAEALTGRRAEEALGRACWEVWPEAARYRDLIDAARGDRTATRRSRDRLDAGGKSRYLDVEAFPLISDGIRGVVLRLEDVSARVQLESASLQGVKMVSVGRLAAGMAHELNNPLGAVMQGVQMLEVIVDPGRSAVRSRMEAAGVDPEALTRYLASRGWSAYLDEIHLAGERAASIVMDLLEFSQRSEFEVRPHDLNALLETTLELAAADYDLKKQYDFRDVEVGWDLAPDLPPVLCDAPQVQLAILNLLQNAGQAMAVRTGRTRTLGSRDDGNGYRPRLALQTRLVGEAIRVSITDNGGGLDPMVADRLFEPFVTTRDVGEGSGLGLWLCWSIVVEHHGGRIWAEPRDEGACFTLEFPTGGPG